MAMWDTSAADGGAAGVPPGLGGAKVEAKLKGAAALGRDGVVSDVESPDAGAPVSPLVVVLVAASWSVGNEEAEWVCVGENEAWCWSAANKRSRFVSRGPVEGVP